MAAELSLESISLKMRQKKLEALAKGHLADYCFLVRPEKGTAQVSFRDFGWIEAINKPWFYFHSWCTASKAT